MPIIVDRYRTLSNHADADLKVLHCVGYLHGVETSFLDRFSLFVETGPASFDNLRRRRWQTNTAEQKKALPRLYIQVVTFRSAIHISKLTFNFLV